MKLMLSPEQSSCISLLDASPIAEDNIAATTGEALDSTCEW
eukprot:CAMPEP_0178374424 /NCGR_PEP_ID=MMETSP0689_2-20121128/2370_1 /TAXON_ID=160604 /ORGANISM="Amphidinium massartii, Strain CS-259" /LENGTH=40 /DNA_ID= /DNA_START= /DNA_END= /DNA_ORIENTATION=